MSIGGAPRNIPHNVKELGGNAREREHIGQKSSNIHLHFSSPEFETLFQQGTIVYRQGITRSKSDERSIHSDDSEECESYQIPVQLKDLEGRSWELSAVVDTGADRSFISRTALSEIGRLKESPIPQDKQKTFTSLFGNAITPKSFIHVKLSSDAIYLDQSVKLKVIEDTEEFQIILGRDFIARYRNSTGQSLLTQVGDLMADKKESRNKARQLGGSKEFNNVSHDSRKTAQVTEALSEKKIDAEIFSTGFGPGEEDSDGEQFGSSILSQRPSPNAVNHDTVNSNRVEASSVEAIMTPAKAQRLNESLAGDDRNEYSSSDESQNSSSGPPSVIFSDVTAPSSSTSQLSTEESVAARELVALLLEDRMLETLFLAALKDPKIGPERFQRNFRILLKVYSRNLREEAQNSLHREAARLVLSRARYTANSIRMILGPEDEKGKELNWWVMSQRSRQQGLGKAIRAWKDRSALSGTEDQDDTKNSDDEIPELDSDSDNESSNLQSLAEDIKEFMISGNAFRNLQRNFSEFVHPPRTYRSADDKHKTSGKTNDHIPLGEEELEVQEICAENVVSRDDTGSAPNPDYLSLSHPTILIDHRRAIRFTPWTLVPRPRIVDQAKRRVEVFLRCPIIWWPLKPYKTVCPNDCIRMDWTCGCGAELYSDLPTDTANEYARRCTPLTLSPSDPPILPVYNTEPSSPASASASGASAQVGNANPPSNITQRSGLSQTPESTQNTSITHTQAGIVPTISRNRFLHWCVDANISDTHLFHIPVPNLRDASVLSELKTMFSAAKGLRKWISLTDCHDVRFMMFQRISIHHSKELISCSKEALPPVTNGGDYIYKYEDPLEQFTQSLRQSLIHHMHNSSCCSIEDIEDTLDRIPKKANGKLENKRRAVGYGILAVPGLSFWKVILALALVHIGPLIFLGRWLRGHPGDLQNGTQLLFYLMTLLNVLVVIPDMWSLWSVKRDKDKTSSSSVLQ